MYHLQLITPEEIVFDSQVAAVIAPGEDGYFGVLTNHAPLLASLKKGILIITDVYNKKSYYAVSAGFLEVSHNILSVIVKSAEPTNPIDIGIGEGI